MGEIRFVGPGETRGYPYLVCKKDIVYNMTDISIFCNFENTAIQI